MREEPSGFWRRYETEFRTAEEPGERDGFSRSSNGPDTANGYNQAVLHARDLIGQGEGLSVTDWPVELSIILIA